MDRQRLGDVLPEYALELAQRLRGGDWAHLADSVGDIRFSSVLIADDRCAFLAASHSSERIGALRVELAEEVVEIKLDRIVYIEIREPKPVKLAIRSLTAAAAALA
jgi:hypothetical protein